MTTFASDLGDECLVTDLVHELSSGLQIPFLLSGSPTFEGICFNELKCEKEKNDYPLSEQNTSNTQNFGKTDGEFLSDIDDLQSYVIKNEDFVLCSKTDSSGCGSGSDCSSTDLWSVKNELDTPPVTPSEERISPDNVFLASNNKLTYIPILKGNHRKSKKGYSSLSKTVRIQPKPDISSFNIDNQQCCNQAVMCNVFKSVQTSITDNKNSASSSLMEKKNMKLSRKDLEVLQAKRKQERMIRNRESAYLSRKRKKEYVTYLEKQVQGLINENNQLRQENYELKERLMKCEDLDYFGTGKKARNVFTSSSMKTTALLALMLTVCVNFGSFRSFIYERNKSQNYDNLVNDDKLPFHVQNIRHTRSLLWSDKFEDMRSSLTNLSKTSCPVNQTESIRLESELRRWIRRDEDFSRPLKQSTNKINHFFNTSARLAKNHKSRRKSRIRKTNTASNVEVDVYQMKSHFFNFDTFFEAIQRRDDTFYLVSFSADHLLLPALSHNKTSRPKMSLMLPAFLSNETLGVSSDLVEVMQIDCEVTNTQLLSVSENDIPSLMRPYSNTTERRKDSRVEVSQLSQYLIDGLSEKKNTEENVVSSLLKATRNFSSLRRANFSGTQDFDDEVMKYGIQSKKLKTNALKFRSFHSNSLLNRTEKNKQELSRISNNKEYYFQEKYNTGSNSNNVTDRNYNDVGVQFLQPNAKNFLKTVMPPHTKNVGYSKKPYFKTIRSAMKFLFP